MKIHFEKKIEFDDSIPSKKVEKKQEEKKEEEENKSSLNQEEEIKGAEKEKKPEKKKKEKKRYIMAILPLKTQEENISQLEQSIFEIIISKIG